MLHLGLQVDGLAIQPRPSHNFIIIRTEAWCSQWALGVK